MIAILYLIQVLLGTRYISENNPLVYRLWLKLRKLLLRNNEVAYNNNVLKIGEVKTANKATMKEELYKDTPLEITTRSQQMKKY